jgi:hypothetical protein
MGITCLNHLDLLQVRAVSAITSGAIRFAIAPYGATGLKMGCIPSLPDQTARNRTKRADLYFQPVGNVTRTVGACAKLGHDAQKV